MASEVPTHTKPIEEAVEAITADVDSLKDITAEANDLPTPQPNTETEVASSPANEPAAQTVPDQEPEVTMSTSDQDSKEEEAPELVVNNEETNIPVVAQENEQEVPLEENPVEVNSEAEEDGNG